MSGSLVFVVFALIVVLLVVLVWLRGNLIQMMYDDHTYTGEVATLCRKQLPEAAVVKQVRGHLKAAETARQRASPKQYEEELKEAEFRTVQAMELLGLTDQNDEAQEEGDLRTRIQKRVRRIGSRAKRYEAQVEKLSEAAACMQAGAVALSHFDAALHDAHMLQDSSNVLPDRKYRQCLAGAMEKYEKAADLLGVQKPEKDERPWILRLVLPKRRAPGAQSKVKVKPPVTGKGVPKKK